MALFGIKFSYYEGKKYLSTEVLCGTFAESDFDFDRAREFAYVIEQQMRRQVPNKGSWPHVHGEMKTAIRKIQ